MIGTACFKGFILSCMSVYTANMVERGLRSETPLSRRQNGILSKLKLPFNTTTGKNLLPYLYRFATPDRNDLPPTMATYLCKRSGYHNILQYYKRWSCANDSRRMRLGFLRYFRVLNNGVR